jgi:hypothetical protein
LTTFTGAGMDAGVLPGRPECFGSLLNAHFRFEAHFTHFTLRPCKSGAPAARRH